MGSETGLTQTDTAELSDIVWHWEKAYNVSRDGSIYAASRIGYPEHILTAGTASELRSMIRSDYHAWLATLNERSSL